jgi:hypothetical protein
VEGTINGPGHRNFLHLAVRDGDVAVARLLLDMGMGWCWCDAALNLAIMAG